MQVVEDIRRNQEFLKLRGELTKSLINDNSYEFYATRVNEVPPADFTRYLIDIWFYHIKLIYLGKATKSVHVVFANNNNDNIRISLEIPWSSGFKKGFYLRKYLSVAKENNYDALFIQTTERDD
jgi:hypothetical protein